MKNSEKLAKEISKRKDKKVDVCSMIGAEIKAQRQKLNLTLKKAVEGICSTSYLSKIENNMIAISAAYIEKLCERVMLGKDFLQKLENINKYEVEMIEAVYQRDREAIRRIFNEIRELDNYRVKIIKFIYYVFEKNYELAMIEREKLMKLYKSIDNSEVEIFGLFSAILDYNNYMYEDAVIVLQSIVKISRDETIIALCYEYLFLCYYKVNSRKFLSIDEKTINIARDHLLYDRIEEYMFYKYKYYLANHMDEALDLLKQLSKTKYHQTAKFLYDLSVMNNIDDKANANGFVSAFYELLYLLYTNNNSFDNVFSKSKHSLTEEEYLYLEFIRAKAASKNSIIDDASSFCFRAIKLNSVALIGSTLQEACQYYRSKYRYKSIADITDRANAAINKLEKI